MKITVHSRDEYGSAVSREFAAGKKSHAYVNNETGLLAVRGEKQNAVFAKGEWTHVVRDL